MTVTFADRHVRNGRVFVGDQLDDHAADAGGDGVFRHTVAQFF